jgi:hypothetical protein
MKPIRKAQEGRQSLIDGSNLLLRELTKYATDPPLVDGSQMVDQGERPLGKATLAGRKGRI